MALSALVAIDALEARAAPLARAIQALPSDGPAPDKRGGTWCDAIPSGTAVRGYRGAPARHTGEDGDGAVGRAGLALTFHFGSLCGGRDRGLSVADAGRRFAAAALGQAING
ncbi:MAG: hypothetical protein HS122_03455 [Opitutaceae bacterium]|nr:hypothetical protein [Opitutaceae bacterium]